MEMSSRCGILWWAGGRGGGGGGAGGGIGGRGGWGGGGAGEIVFGKINNSATTASVVSRSEATSTILGSHG